MCSSSVYNYMTCKGKVQCSSSVLYCAFYALLICIEVIFHGLPGVTETIPLPPIPDVPDLDYGRPYREL
jgi:hypothetical protein